MGSMLNKYVILFTVISNLLCTRDVRPRGRDQRKKMFQKSSIFSNTYNAQSKLFTLVYIYQIGAPKMKVELC